MTMQHPNGPFTRTFSLEFPDRSINAMTVIRFEGEERLSRPYRFVIEFVARDSDLDELINRKAVFTIGGSGTGRKSVYRGVVVEIEQKGRTKGYDFYRAVVMPAMSALTRHVGSEIYIDDQTMPEVVKKIFEDHRIQHDLRSLPQHTPDRPPLICRYEESLLDFATRLMEREGLYYYFEEEAGQETVVIAGSKNAHKPSALELVYRETARRDDKHGESAIPILSMRRQTMPRRVVLKSYNYRQSSLGLQEIAAAVKEDGVGEIVLTDDYFRTPSEGEHLAEMRAEAIKCRERLFSAESAAVGLKAGALFKLTQHYRDDFNQQYLVSAVSHRGSQPAVYLSGMGIDVPDDPSSKPYWNRMELIPGALQFRPERLTPKPRISGTITAIVDSEGSGTYAVINEDGEYKVRFPTLGLGRERLGGKRSCWMRLASPYGGKDHGQHFPLLKGTEVMVAFKDGDPDQPFISGTLPNSSNKSVVTEDNLTDNVLKTASGNSLVMGDQDKKTHLTLKTAGGHLLDMNDAAGKSGIGLATQSGDQSVRLKDEGARGEIVLAAATPLEGMGISAPVIGNIQEIESRLRIGSAASGIEMLTNNSFNRVTLVSDTSISLGNHSKLALGVMSSFALGMDSAVAGGPYSRDLLWGGSEYSAKTITRFCGQEYVNLNQKALIAGQEGVAIGGGFLPTVDVPYRSLKIAFVVSLALSIATTGAGCTTGIMHSPLKVRLAVTGATIAIAAAMWKIKKNFFTALMQAPLALSYGGLLKLNLAGSEMSANPGGGYLRLTMLGATIASDKPGLNSFTATKAGVAVKGAAIDINAVSAARLQGKSGVQVCSPGVFSIEGGAGGQVKVGTSSIRVTPASVQVDAGAIVKIG
jgi:type VI secretion system VgrG family protein